MFGVQSNFLGNYAYYEVKLSPSTSLRSELALTGGVWTFSRLRPLTYMVTSAVNLEPRWYYNLQKRTAKGKSIANNYANYFSLQMGFQPDFMVLGNVTSEDSVIVPYATYVFPTWGMRRRVSTHFNVEFGARLGYIYAFSDKKDFINIGRMSLRGFIRLEYLF